MEQIQQALIDGALQLIAGLVAGIPLTLGVAYAWLRRQARLVAEDAATEAEITGREIDVHGPVKKSLAVAHARERMPRIKGLFTPSDADIEALIERSLPKARARADKA